MYGNISSNATFPSHMSVYVNASFSTLIMLLAIPGNFAMILIFIRVKKLRDLNNTAITFLSSSDFVRACVVMPLKIYHQMTFVETLSEPTCTITAIICGFTFVFSPMTLALIGVVRYCKVVPWASRSFELSKAKFYRTAAVVFLISTSFALLPVIGITGKYSYSPSHGVCFTNWSHKNETFRTIFYILVIGLAFPVLTVCYFLLFKALRKHNKNLTGVGRETSVESKSTDESPVGTRGMEIEHNATPRDNVEVSHKDVAVIFKTTGDHVKRTKKNKTAEKECSSCSSHSGDNEKKAVPLRERFSTNTSKASKASTVSQVRFCKHISKQERQVTRLMMIIFVAYCLCWIPAAIINAMALYHKHKTNEKIPLIYFYVIVTLVELKCALNPLIYGLGNRKYRKALKDIFKTIKFWSG